MFAYTKCSKQYQEDRLCYRNNRHVAVWRNDLYTVVHGLDFSVSVVPHTDRYHLLTYAQPAAIGAFSETVFGKPKS